MKIIEVLQRNIMNMHIAHEQTKSLDPDRAYAYVEGVKKVYQVCGKEYLLEKRKYQGCWEEYKVEKRGEGKQYSFPFNIKAVKKNIKFDTCTT